MTEDEGRAKVVEEAKTWEWTPSRHRGMVKGLEGGVDCGTFIFCVFKTCGLIEGTLPENYSAQWWAHREGNIYLNEFDKFCTEMPPMHERTPKPGDVILFRYGRALGHGAIIMDFPICMHLHPKSAMVVFDNITMGTSFIGRERHVFAIKGWS